MEIHFLKDFLQSSDKNKRPWMTSSDLKWPFISGIISRVQAKSFTKALNALLKEEDEIKNLFSDLKDGKKLIKVVRHFTGADLVSLTLFDLIWLWVNFGGGDGENDSS